MMNWHLLGTIWHPFWRCFFMWYSNFFASNTYKYNHACHEYLQLSMSINAFAQDWQSWSPKKLYNATKEWNTHVLFTSNSSIRFPSANYDWAHHWLVVSTHLKNMAVKLDHFPRDRGENKKYLKPPPSYDWAHQFNTKTCPSSFYPSPKLRWPSTCAAIRKGYTMVTLVGPANCSKTMLSLAVSLLSYLWLHPWRLTWNLKMAPWKRRSLLETIIFRFYVKLWGCMLAKRPLNFECDGCTVCTQVHHEPPVVHPNNMTN